MKVIMAPNPYRDRNFQYVYTAKRILQECGVETRVCLPFGVDKSFELPKDLDFCNLETELGSADVLICFGGDGTILHSSKAATFRNVPVLGVNIGTMGFMAELEASELPMLSELAAGHYTIENRMMLDVRAYREKSLLFSETALNDMVLSKGVVARVIQLSVSCDGELAGNYSGDGLIVCTPTGSTAYSLSAGGPIVDPKGNNIVVTPVCAHSFQTKGFVASGDRKLEIQIGKTGKKSAVVSIDGGRAHRLNVGDKIQIRRSSFVTRLVRIKNTSFFEVIRSKFN